MAGIPDGRAATADLDEEQMTQITGSDWSPGAPAPAAGGFPKTEADHLTVPGNRTFGSVPSAELTRVLISAGVPVTTAMGRHEVASIYERYIAAIGKAGWDQAVNAWLQGVTA